MEVTRHFTVSVFIVHNAKVLLLNHKKLKLLLPVGGHIDRDELPQDAAIREAKEEAGLAISLYNPDPHLGFQSVHQLVRPQILQLEDINEFHQHIDFIFYAKSESDRLAPGEGESKDLQWYSAEEIKKLKAPDNVKMSAMEALDIVG